MRSICMIVLFAVFAAIDAQTGLWPTFEAPVNAFPTFEAAETVEPWEAGDPTTASPGVNPAVMRGWPNQQRQDQEYDSESGEDVDTPDTTDAPDPQQAPDAQDTPDAIAGNQAGTGQSSGEQPANFINFGGKPFKGFKKPTKQDAQTMAGKTIGIILSTLFIVAAAAVVAVIVIRRKRSS